MNAPMPSSSGTDWTASFSSLFNSPVVTISACLIVMAISVGVVHLWTDGSIQVSHYQQHLFKKTNQKYTPVQLPSSKPPTIPANAILVQSEKKKDPSIVQILNPSTSSSLFKTSNNPLPDPDPLLEFDYKTAKTRDHIYANKTLRWPYFQTMAHQPMNVNDWIEIDSAYERDLNMKKQVIKEHGTKVLNSLPENDQACGELLRTLVDWLPKRYPTLFQLVSDEKDQGGIHNAVTNETYLNTGKLQGVEALQVISRLVQDDFLMGREREDGQVYFVGGIVAHPGFYDFSQKINKSLKEVHEPVPQFNEKMLRSVERTLKRFGPNEPFERSSWEMVDDYNLFHHNIASLPEGATLAEDLHPKDYLFRIDHQTFRKLPESRGIIFGVHPILRRLEEFAASPMVPALLATIHEQAQSDLMKYKLADMYQEKMIPYLKELTRLQIENGWIKGDENVSDFRDLLLTSPPKKTTANPSSS